jgi:hypothetical protein
MRILFISLLILSTATVAETPYRRSKLKPALLIQTLDAAESEAGAKAKKILQIGREMTLEKKEIVIGGCWNYVDAVYTRAGFPNERRKIVFKGSQQSGPYADREALKPGDWIYHVNHSYNDIEHSGIFVKWLDKKNAFGLLLSYRGERSKRPARYRGYDLSHVYTITRAK